MTDYEIQVKFKSTNVNKQDYLWLMDDLLKITKYTVNRAMASNKKLIMSINEVIPCELKKIKVQGEIQQHRSPWFLKWRDKCPDEWFILFQLHKHYWWWPSLLFLYILLTYYSIYIKTWHTYEWIPSSQLIIQIYCNQIFTILG